MQKSFLDNVRAKQAQSMQTLKGRSGLQLTQRIAIRAVATSMAIAGKPPKLAQAEMIRLLERFEEMARRQKMIVQAELRPALLGLLVTEFWVNKHALDSPAEKLIAATAYHGAIGIRLGEEFPQFQDTPGLLRHAVINYPADPGRFLRKTQDAIDSMASVPEFAEFRDTPGMYKQAAVRNPSDPSGFLRSVRRVMIQMRREPEFEEFRNMPSLFKQAAVSNPSDPREYMRKLQKNIAQLMKEDEFKNFLSTPGVFRQAVIRSPQNPQAFLRKVQQDIGALSSEEEFSEFHDKPSILQHAAIHNTSNPREFLRRKPKAIWHAMLVKKREAKKTTDNPKKKK